MKFIVNFQMTLSKPYSYHAKGIFETVAEYPLKNQRGSSVLVKRGIFWRFGHSVGWILRVVITGSYIYPFHLYPMPSSCNRNLSVRISSSINTSPSIIPQLA